MRPSEDICNIRSNSHFLASSLNGLLKTDGYWYDRLSRKGEVSQFTGFMEAVL